MKKRIFSSSHSLLYPKDNCMCVHVCINKCVTGSFITPYNVTSREWIYYVLFVEGGYILFSKLYAYIKISGSTTYRKALFRNKFVETSWPLSLLTSLSTEKTALHCQPFHTNYKHSLQKLYFPLWLPFVVFLTCTMPFGRTSMIVCRLQRLGLEGASIDPSSVWAISLATVTARGFLASLGEGEWDGLLVQLVRELSGKKGRSKCSCERERRCAGEEGMWESSDDS